MTTRADIIDTTLRDLRILGVGDDAPDARDAADVGKRLDDIYAELRAEGLNRDHSGVWDLDDVPPEYTRPLVRLTMHECADLFHLPEDRVVRLQLQAVEARNALRRRAATLNEGEPAKAEYY